MHGVGEQQKRKRRLQGKREMEQENNKSEDNIELFLLLINLT